jgi:hypothetical protein
MNESRRCKQEDNDGKRCTGILVYRENGTPSGSQATSKTKTEKLTFSLGAQAGTARNADTLSLRDYAWGEGPVSSLFLYRSKQISKVPPSASDSSVS